MVVICPSSIFRFSDPDTISAFPFLTMILVRPDSSVSIRYRPWLSSFTSPTLVSTSMRNDFPDLTMIDPRFRVRPTAFSER